MRMVNGNVAFKTIRMKVLLGLFIVTIPLIFFLIYNNVYAIDVVRNQVAQSNINLIGLHMGQIDRDLEEIDKQLLQMAAQEMDLITFGRLEDLNPDRYNLTKIHLYQSLSSELNNYNTVDYFFAYSAKNMDLLIASGQIEEIEYVEREKTKNDIASYIKIEQSIGEFQHEKWTHLKTENNDFLFHIIKTGSVYIGALVNVKKLMVPLQSIDLGKGGKAFLVAENKIPIGDVDPMRDNSISYTYIQNSYILSGAEKQYLIVGEKSNKGNFSLIVALSEYEVLKNLPFIQRMVSYLLSGTIVIIFISLWCIRKFILFPINQIVIAMRRVRNGDLDARIAPYSTSSEFELVNDTFNTMAEQIQRLRINIYEEQLNHQKSELKHLQLQINPHFFLNSLNIIYYLAQVKDFSLIQEMSLCLIQYFRYMFQSNFEFVSLEDEIKHTRNYLRIQELRFPKHLAVTMSIADSLWSYAVPPLVVQSFAENTIKHAVSLDSSIRINIEVSHDLSVPAGRMKILIEDTGKGFSDEVLQQLQQNSDLSHADGKHIGIWNVKRRLMLLYRGQAHISFSNLADNGARVEISIPLLQPDNRGNQNV
jgi:two-component system sensor histidine kinase YesM